MPKISWWHGELGKEKTIILWHKPMRIQDILTNLGIYLVICSRKRKCCVVLSKWMNENDDVIYGQSLISLSDWQPVLSHKLVILWDCLRGFAEIPSESEEKAAVTVLPVCDRGQQQQTLKFPTWRVTSSCDNGHSCQSVTGLFLVFLPRYRY